MTIEPPDAYNRKRYERGELRFDHLTHAIELLQAELGVTVDGMYGPATLKAFQDAYTAVTVSSVSQIAKAAVSVAVEEIGNGEEHQNNAGKDLHRYRDYPYDDDYERPIGEWCAFFVGYCWEQAAMRTGVELPFARRFYDGHRNRQMPIGSAKALGRRIAAAGSEVHPNRAQPGDVMVWDRGRRGSRAGHVGIVERVDYSARIIHTIEGNVGGFPARVDRRQWDMDRPGRLELIARV